MSIPWCRKLCNIKLGMTQRRPPVPSFKGLLPSSEAASRVKRANCKNDTKPELVLRKALFAAGMRYRKYVRRLPGNPDIVFSKARVALFCDGDFWHGRNWPTLRSKLKRRHNADYWVAKIARNRAREFLENTSRLSSEGWLVVRLWESDITLRSKCGCRDRASNSQRAADANSPPICRNSSLNVRWWLVRSTRK